jgi:two-component system CheB/CheR fusion protein
MTVSNAGLPGSPTMSAPPDEVARLIELIHERRGFDLRDYKRSSIGRSIARRATACKCPSIEKYRAMVQESEPELDALLSHIMVGYSAFFRDPGLFDVLRRRVLPDIVKRRSAETPRRIRAWSVACATGEEAYSLAILIFEALDGCLDRFDIKLFATDVDRTALAKARAGRYTREDLEEMDAKTRARYFTGAGPFTVRPFLRRMVRFGEHNVFADPPISKLDLIACRNVLIYLNKEAQIRALENLRYGLVPGGYLVLGTSEKPRAEVEAAFEPLDKEWRTYRKIEGLQR